MNAFLTGGTIGIIFFIIFTMAYSDVKLDRLTERVIKLEAMK